MSKLTLPYKGMTAWNISQTFHKDHQALDIFKIGKDSGYGVPLCAPEDVEVLKITGDTLTEGNHSLEHGYGVFLKGLETGYSYLFWHTLPVLPVDVGDKVKRGKIIAYMGNAGNVYNAGKYVPLEKRTSAPFAGTHLHLEMFDKGYKVGKKKVFINPLLHIDFTLEPTYSTIDQLNSARKVLLKIAGLLK